MLICLATSVTLSISDSIGWILDTVVGGRLFPLRPRVPGITRCPRQNLTRQDTPALLPLCPPVFRTACP